jgi:DNA (cytosine-5)-methyltransferase 1
LPKRLDLPDWCALRPSTTVVWSFRPEMQAAPGWRKPGDPPRQNTPESVKLSLSERLVLQGFPPDFPVQGPRTARDLQVGNAIPPRLAKAAVEAVAGGIRA